MAGAVDIEAGQFLAVDKIRSSGRIVDNSRKMSLATV
jgi:hypothetical protein